MGVLVWKPKQNAKLEGGHAQPELLILPGESNLRERFSEKQNRIPQTVVFDHRE